MAKVKKATKKTPSKKIPKKASAKKAVKKPAKKATKKATTQSTIADTKAIRLQEADILLQRMRDAGISTATNQKPRPQIRKRPAQSASQSASVRILIDTDEITVIKRTSQTPSSNPSSQQSSFSGYGYDTSAPYGFAAYGSQSGYTGGFGYGVYGGYGAYGSFASAPQSKNKTQSDDLVTLQIKSGGRVIVQTGPEAKDVAKQAEKRIQKK